MRWGLRWERPFSDPGAVTPEPGSRGGGLVVVPKLVPRLLPVTRLPVALEFFGRRVLVFLIDVLRAALTTCKAFVKRRVESL